MMNACIQLAEAHAQNGSHDEARGEKGGQRKSFSSIVESAFSPRIKTAMLHFLEKIIYPTGLLQPGRS